MMAVSDVMSSIDVLASLHAMCVHASSGKLEICVSMMRVLGQV